MEIVEALSGKSIEKMKREWLTKTRQKAGDCCFIAYLSNVPVGFVQCTAPEFFERVKEYSSGPPSNDAAFLACLYVFRREMRRKGIGSLMLKKLLENLKQQGVNAVETFARKGSENNPSGPLSFYLKHGFKIVSEKDDFPLVRLEF